MKFLSDTRLLLLAIWLGAAIFFIGVAQTAFAIISERELAGAIVNRNLTILNFGGMAIAAILLLTSVIGTGKSGQFSLWAERFLVLLVGAACAAGQFVIGYWIWAIRSEMGRPIDELAVDDPLRIQFNLVHEYSVWVLLTAMGTATIAFFIMSNRRYRTTDAPSEDVYDFSKEFKS